MPSGSQHADFYVDLASFELLGFEYPSATIAAASLLCGLWNMKEESLEQPKRLSQVVQLLGSHEGSHLLGSKPGVVVEADVLACMQRLARAFVTLEKDHARIAAEKAAKEEAEKRGTASKASATKGKLTNPPVRPSTPSLPPPLSSVAEASDSSNGAPSVGASADEPSPSALRDGCEGAGAALMAAPGSSGSSSSSSSSTSSDSALMSLDVAALGVSSSGAACGEHPIRRADSLESVCWPTRSMSEAVANSEVAAAVRGPGKDFVPVREDEQTERAESPDGVITTDAFAPAPAAFSAAGAASAAGGSAAASSKASAAPKQHAGAKRNAPRANDDASSRRQPSRRRRVA